MIKELEDIVNSNKIFDLLEGKDWQSIVINKAKPVTIRIFKYINSKRICLHYFESCLEDESFFHAHSWPAAFMILDGSYKLDLGFYQSVDDNNPAEVSKLLIEKDSSYEMINPLVCHKISPIEPTCTIMLNGENYEENLIHKFVKTTKNKNLNSLSEFELKNYLEMFKNLFEKRNSRKGLYV